MTIDCESRERLLARKREIYRQRRAEGYSPSEAVRLRNTETRQRLTQKEWLKKIMLLEEHEYKPWLCAIVWYQNFGKQGELYDQCLISNFDMKKMLSLSESICNELLYKIGFKKRYCGSPDK